MHRKYQGLFCATNIIVCQDTTLKLDFVSQNMHVACSHHNLVLYDGRFHKRDCDNDYDSIHLYLLALSAES